ncbi:myosin light chain kinase A-like [Convolutriloba macropyga]|uniref:myosin light chain kinase A-like n=1 Tax=Convolutriloba macropyga TaxID=536237 RepID=UPI003F51ECFF
MMFRRRSAPGDAYCRPSSLEELAPWLDVKRHETFDERYEVGELRGMGAFHAVREVTHRRSGEVYVCKRSSSHDKESVKDIINEASLLKMLNHENIVSFKDFMRQGQHVYIMTERLAGSTLHEAVADRGSYAEEDARIVMKQTLSAVAHMHRRGVVHRDLKLENIMLSCPLDHTAIKVIDFGLATVTGCGRKDVYTATLSRRCGTPLYTAPEVFEGRYGCKCDMWSAGVMLHMMLSGHPPYIADTVAGLYDEIQKGAKRLFRDPVWQLISPSAIDLVGVLLRADPEERWSAEEALEHPWLTSSR